MKAFGGYTSWQGWLAGKALPFTIFTMFLVTHSLTLPRDAVQLIHEGIGLYSMMEFLRHLLMAGFLLLVVGAYLIRTGAVASAYGFWERIFPLLVLFATVVGMSFLKPAEALKQPLLVAVGLLLTALGYYLSFWSIGHLRGSFGIMAEARSPVMSGPYRYVRHPLYLGESLTMLGLCLAIGTITALLFWAAITVMQLARARIEEGKLSRQFAGYQAYLERTRFILPGLY
jgi:protein-S-isoprenylcysteine O-methyltransferase Ste14